MKFQMGDRVKISDPGVYRYNDTGTVAEVVESGWGTKQVLKIRMPDGELIDVMNTVLVPAS